MPKYLNLQERIYSGDGIYDIPNIKAINDIDVSKWIGFNYAKSLKGDLSNVGVNFFLDDYQFERVWNEPGRYVEYLKKFSVVLSPDFSLYMDFPKAIQIFNHYLKHWCAAYWQEEGLTIDLTHMHNGKNPHVHEGYNHYEGGTRGLSVKERKIVDFVRKQWYNKYGK